MTTDTQGREYAKLSYLEEGDLVEVDEGFTCMSKGEVKTVKYKLNGLYIECKEGKHFLSGQLHDTENFLIGIYKVNP